MPTWLAFALLALAFAAVATWVSRRLLDTPVGWVRSLLISLVVFSLSIPLVVWMLRAVERVCRREVRRRIADRGDHRGAHPRLGVRDRGRRDRRERVPGAHATAPQSDRRDPRGDPAARPREAIRADPRHRLPPRHRAVPEPRERLQRRTARGARRRDQRGGSDFRQAGPGALVPRGRAAASVHQGALHAADGFHRRSRGPRPRPRSATSSGVPWTRCSPRSTTTPMAAASVAQVHARDAPGRHAGRHQDPASSCPRAGDDRPRHPRATRRRRRAAHRVGARLRRAGAGRGVRTRAARRARLPRRGRQHRDAARRDRSIAGADAEHPDCLQRSLDVPDAGARARRRHPFQPAHAGRAAAGCRAHGSSTAWWTRSSSRSPCAACSTPTCTPAT